MMKNMTAKEKLEGYFINLGMEFQQIEKDTWVVSDKESSGYQVMILYEEPIVIVRVMVMKLPLKNREVFFETVLKMNAVDLSHTAYAVTEDSLILSRSFLLDTLDLGELQAVMDEIGLVLVQHYSLLSGYRNL